MLKFLQRFGLNKLKSSFAQNLFLVSGGRSISLVLGLLFTPVLTRIYNPEAYGFFNLYISWINIGLVFSSFSYSQGIVAQKKFNRALNLGIFCCGLSSFLCLVVYIVLESQIFSLDSILVWAIPLGILLTAYNEILSQFNIWFRRFRFTTSLDIFINITNRAQALVYGIYAFHKTGLTVADLGTKLIFFLVNLYKNLDLLKKEISRIDVRYIIKLVRYNIDIPKFYFTSQLVSKGGVYLPNLLIAYLFGQKLLGSYSFTIGMLNIPLQILGSAISSVFYSKATELKERKEELGKVLEKLIQSLLLIIILPFSFIIVYSDFVFNSFFGSEWSKSGYFAQFLSLYYIPMLLYYSIGNLFLVLKKEKKKLIFDSYGLVLAILSFLISWYFDEFLVFIVCYSITNFVLYNCILYYFLNIFNISFTKRILPYYGIMAVIVVVLYILRFFLH